MNIIFITPSLPSEYNRIRSLNLLKALGHNHRVYLVSLSFGKENIEKIEKYYQKVIVARKGVLRALFDVLCGLFSSQPLEVSYVKSRHLKAIVENLIRQNQIDLVYIKRLRAAQFIPNGINIPVLLDTTDAMSLFYYRAFKNAAGFKKLLYLEEWLKYKFYEKKIAQQIKNWVVCSKTDIQYLQKNLPPDVNFHYLPNVVDTKYYQKTDLTLGSHSLLFSGLMDKFVNIEAAQYFIAEIFPLVAKQFSKAKLYIIGPNPSHQVRKLASANIIVTGRVANLRDYIAKASIVICPILTGSGTRNKILQAWSIGRPVVTTPQGIEGLNGQHGIHVMVANNPQIFAHHIIQLWADQDLYQNLVKQGYLLVKNQYSIEALSNSLENLFSKVAIQQEDV